MSGLHGRHPDRRLPVGVELVSGLDELQVLREAARLMRERAEAATPGGPRWESAPDEWGSVRYIFPADSDSAIASVPAVADAEHIASWHPDVALAVADLLDVLADPADMPAALAVARAYLGSEVTA